MILENLPRIENSCISRVRRYRSHAIKGLYLFCIACSIKIGASLAKGQDLKEFADNAQDCF